MTQSDAPNEGREEKQVLSEEVKQEMKTKALAFANERSKIWSLFQTDRDLVSHTYKEIFITEILPLRDQLSKERELTKVLTQEVADLRVSNSLLIDNESKERKMRKELVDTLKEIYEYITDEGILEDLAGVEELIKRASEPDKNEKA